MYWGRQWGNYWGLDTISPLQITDMENYPPEALVEWTHASVTDPLYHVYVDGKFYATTQSNQMVVQFQSTGRHWVEIFLSSTANPDEDLSSFVSSIPGCRVRLTWTASPASDVHHYNIYWDQGLGGGLTYLDRTDSTETEWIGDVLSDGTYKYRVDPVDDAGNQTTSSTDVTVIIARYPNPPSALTLDSFDSGTQTANFSFTESTTPPSVTGYRVYHNGGSGDIDYATVRSTIAAGNTTFTLNLTTSGSWKVGLRAYNAVYEEDNVDVFVEFDLGGSPVDHLEDKPNIPQGLSAMPAAGGTFTLRCTYMAADEKSKATQINFYADDGVGGSINYTSTIATAAVDDHTLAEHAILDVTATSSALVDTRTYTFACKAATASGTESDASDTATGTADATAPGDITNLAGSAVNYES